MKFNWSDQRIAQLKAMVADGGTAGSIAAEWSVSRNTVAGKMDRLGLRRDQPPKEPKQPRKPQIRRHKKNRLIGPVMPVAAPPPPPEPLPPPPFHPGPVELGDNPVMALTWASCRFPLGDPRHADFKFCCAPKLGVSPYCEDHHRIAYAVKAAGAEAKRMEVAAP